MENHGRRMAHGDPRPARTPSSREQRSSFYRVFYETVVQHVAELAELYTLDGTTPRNFQFSGTGVVAALQPVR